MKQEIAAFAFAVVVFATIAGGGILILRTLVHWWINH